jgi:hypothetical protein
MMVRLLHLMLALTMNGVDSGMTIVEKRLDGEGEAGL